MSKQKYPQTTVTTSTGAVRKGREHYSTVKLDAKLKMRQQQADDRQFKYDSLTLKEKIARVTARGGSVKELARLNAAANLERVAASLKAEKSAKKPAMSEQQRRD